MCHWNMPVNRNIIFMKKKLNKKMDKCLLSKHLHRCEISGNDILSY